MAARNNVGDNAPLRLAVSAVAGSMMAGGAAKGRLVIERTMTLRAARIDATRIVFAKSQQFARPLMTLWHAVGMHANCECLTREARLWWRRGTGRPAYGKIKAARCGPVGWIESIGISAPWSEVHFAPQPAFSNNARKINARCTSHAAAWINSAVRACSSVAQRVIRLFGAALMSWHTAAMARSQKWSAASWPSC